ncbi:crotonase/enoyl-CoA hydratase family protein [Chelativorans salis]|uniref:Crotonase/enoyl-CoA hydratase family protein n=1 Tax=Chelativorans salis TaxID=2978478 RepID=A0ABT2LV93_9HYPH|nr:crotonase/enoyl-CoA hydratase family protein [Chelativorans sp. EGI FJ00035]MCT7377104.1 crotonase/enoyl-CoA hydratase family protein [Chelativorans sp. EGI FJ00035]
MNEIPAFGDVLSVRIEEGIAHLKLTRPEKQNALNDRVIDALDRFFAKPGEDVRVVVLSGAGNHFSAGLDLGEHVERSAAETMHHSRNWHRVMDLIQFGGLPVVSALHGGAIGGGLELAAATHVRVAEPSAFFQLPEGRRGIFVGGGASVRIGRILGPDRLTEMMLTGRKYDADEALSLGLVHYRVDEGEALAKAEKLARQIAGNAPLSNHLIIQSLARIDDMSRADGLFTESLCAALSVSSEDAREGLTAFLEKRSPRFR